MRSPAIDETRSNRLAAFVEWVGQHITGDEKGEAQIYLDRLFQAFTQKGLLEVGGRPEFRIKRRGEDEKGTAFADYVWKPVVLIEMKKRGTDLSRHFRQAFDYWVGLAPNRPQYVVLCNFDEFRIYDFDEDINEPKDVLSLRELPQRYEPLAFLFPTRERPRFKVDRIAVTQAAADRLALVYGKLKHRRDVGPVVAQRFILQMLIALFSEDIGLLPRQFVTQLLDECIDPPTAFDLLGGLFRAMSTRDGAGGGRFREVQYFNGGIFAEPAPVELGGDELSNLKEAARENWSHISPDIFGTIFQHSLEDETTVTGQQIRHAFGAHYTSPVDIMKIVQPTIVTPWRNAIERANSPDDLLHLQQRLYTYRVLDPACGSGNFLYIAYRELRRIEFAIKERLREIAPSRRAGAQRELAFLRTQQFFGMDIIPFAVELAKVTLTLAPKLSIDELHTDENALPLDNLDRNIVCVDALIDWPIDGSTPNDFEPKKMRAKTQWLPADVIIGNPPFLGAKRLKPERGADYVNAVRKAYPEVPGMADYCVYWIRRTHDHLQECVPDDPFRGRAGLVGTQNIRNNQSRVGGLDHVVKSGTIVEAVDNQPWSGEANVHVSIVNWVKHPPPPPRIPGAAPLESPEQTADRLLIPRRKKLWHKVDASLPLYDPPAESRGRRVTTVASKRSAARKDKSYELAGKELILINAALSSETDVTGAHKLTSNNSPQRCFTGQMIGHEKFLLSEAERSVLLERDRRSRAVFYPHLNGREFLEGGRIDRFVIDFGTRDQVEAAGLSAAFEWVRRHVLPDRRRAAEQGKDSAGRQRSHHKAFLARWWQLAFPRPELLTAIETFERFLVCSRVTKRPVFVFVAGTIRPGDALSCFAFDDDYSFGILQSNAHWQWFVAKCSKLTERFRYTPESVFDTFPWPQGEDFAGPTKKQIDAVADAGRKIRRLRAEALKSMRGGLRALYRTLELPGKSALKDAHAVLDQAVLDAYGFAKDGDLLKQLLELNLEVARRIDRAARVVAPGIPPSYPTSYRDSLVTDDCIRP